MNAKFQDFLKIQRAYDLKTISRQNSNYYFCGKSKQFIQRHETNAEHVYSMQKLAQYFYLEEPEFENLDMLKVYEIILYHDDHELLDDDIEIKYKKQNNFTEQPESVFVLANEYPEKQGKKLEELDLEYRLQETREAKFAKAIDKMDALIHELKYPQDWGPKGYVEESVRKWFGPYFDYSPTFKQYFELIIDYLNVNGYFEVEQ